MLVAVPSICDNIFLPSRGLCLSMFGSCYVIPYLYTSYGMSDTHPGFAFLRSYVSSLYNTPRSQINVTLGKHKELHLVVLNVGVLNGHSPQYNKVFHALMSSTLPFAHLIVPLSPSRSCTYSRVKYNFVPRLMRPNQNVLTYRNASYFSHSCNGCICGHLTESGITVNVVSVSTSSPT